MRDKYPGMTPARWNDLMYGDATRLTEAERAEGWHWCCEWDDLLIHPSWPEYGACSCSCESCGETDD